MWRVLLFYFIAENLMDRVFRRFLCAVLSLNILWVAGVYLSMLLAKSQSNLEILASRQPSRLQSPCGNTTEQRNSKSIQPQIPGAKSERNADEEDRQKRNSTSESQGYIVALRHYEQQTQGLRNFLQLQCLANSYGMRTVEPFMDRSSPSVPLEKMLKAETKFKVLGDLVDIDLWNIEVRSTFGYQPMSTWDEFLKFAPRNVVLGCMQHQNPPNLHVPQPGSDYKIGCRDECFSRHKVGLRYLEQYGFVVVRQACANFYNFAGAVTTDSLLENLLGRHKREQVTIILNEFRGFFGLYRLQVLSNCGMIHNRITVPVLPSAKTMKDSQKYITQHFQDKPYIAILIRVERLVLHLHWNVTDCAAQIISVLDRLHSKQSLPRKYFLAMDVGMYGSLGSVQHHLLLHGKNLFKSIYKDTWSFNEWEKSFDNFTKSPVSREDAGVSERVVNEAGYIANLQRTVAAKSACLVMVAGGGFQSQARDYYKTFHPNQKDQCIQLACMADVAG